MRRRARKHVIMRNASIIKAFRWAPRQERKILVHMRQTAPVVEIRPLAVYESLAMGGAL